MIFLYLIMFFIIEEFWGQMVICDGMFVYEDWLIYGIDFVNVDVDCEMNWVI